MGVRFNSENQTLRSCFAPGTKKGEKIFLQGLTSTKKRVWVRFYKSGGLGPPDSKFSHETRAREEKAQMILKQGGSISENHCTGVAKPD